MTIKLFEVGGSIRDELLGIDNPPDRDFCAESPDGFAALMVWATRNMKKVFLVTPEFLTIRGMMPNGTSIDIVMCRKDGPSSNGRHPDHVIPGTLMDDLARRDFTVNAIAREVDPATLEPIGDLIDPFNGRQHLDAGILRCVGMVSSRFEEDGLRVLRAARFSITKNLEPCHEIKVNLESGHWWAFVGESVSVERIREEINKMMKHSTVDTLRFFQNNCHSSAINVLFKNIWLKPTLERRR